MYHRIGVNQRRAPISLNDQVWALAENVTATAITVEVIGEETKIPHQLHIEVQTAAPTSHFEGLQGQRIVELETPQDGSQLDMERPASRLAVEGDFANQILVRR